MPYLHWETSRNREIFARKTEEILHQRKKALLEEDTEKKWGRKNARMDLFHLPRPVSETSSDDKENSAKRWTMAAGIQKHIQKWFSGTSKRSRPSSSTSHRSSSDSEQANGVAKHASQNGHHKLAPSARLPTVFFNFTKQKRTHKTDEHGRVLIDNKLGQYLIDAARLFEGMTNFRDKQILKDNLTTDAPLHPRRTLDQAYYWSLNTTQRRDQDQVVYRATTASKADFHRWDPEECTWKENILRDPEIKDHKNCEDCTEKIRMVSRVVMVDQLWMWILDERTIITCFPRRYGANKHDNSGIHKSIRVRLGEKRHPQIRSVFDLALIIFEECSNTFFNRTRIWDKQPHMLDAFSEAIGNIVSTWGKLRRLALLSY